LRKKGILTQIQAAFLLLALISLVIAWIVTFMVLGVKMTPMSVGISLLLWLLLGFILPIWVAHAIHYRLRKPLEKLTALCHDISRGFYDLEIPSSMTVKDTEIYGLAEAFERMRLNLVSTIREHARLYLETRSNDFSGFFDASRIVNSSLDLDTIFDRVVRVAMKLLHADSTAITLVDESDGGVQRIKAAQGHSARTVEEFSQAPDEGLGGWVIREKKPLVVHDVEKDPRFVNALLKAEGIRSVLCVPILSEGKALGALYADFRQAHRFSEEEVKLLYTLANQAAVAIRNARLFAQVMSEKERSEAILQSMDDGVMTLDGDLRIRSFNRAAERITGYTAAEALGRECWLVLRGISPEENQECRADRCFFKLAAEEQVGGVHYELKIKARDGSEKFISVSASPLKKEHFAGGVIVFHDISQMMELEGLKADIITSVSHELKTPLTAIKSLIGAMLHPRAACDSKKIRECLVMMDEESDRLAREIEKLMEAARFRSGKLVINPQPISMDEIYRKLEDRLSRISTRHSFSFESEGSLWVLADPVYLEYVIYHLGGNAVKFSPDGGPIRISAREEGECVAVGVSDRGIGIPFDQKEKIFELFHRVDFSPTRWAYGSGTGLYLVKHIVQAHGGDISVESTLGEGSTFTFRLPKSPARKGVMPGEGTEV
jgi:PAS domain S-box-containing protein